MKFTLIHPDATGRYDPPGSDTIRQIPGRVDDPKEADVLLMPVSRFDEFRFDDSLNDIEKPWVLFNWTENGWDWDQKETQFFGLNTQKFFGEGYNEEWEKFDKFVREHPPLMVFQRELLSKDVTDKVQPLDYLNWLPVLGGETRENLFKRPLELTFNFGRSHEGRMWLHGSIFQNAGRLGYDVVSDFSHVERALKDNGRKWLSAHVPHYARIDVRDVQRIVRMAPILIVAPGAGVKTFRLGECCADAIMAIPENNLASAYPWTAENSIVLPKLDSIEAANLACQKLADTLMDFDGLWKRYCMAMDNSFNYDPDNYMRRHVANRIEGIV